MSQSLAGYKVFLSSSVPEDREGQFRAQDHFSLLTSLIGSILQAGGLLVFGGHPSVTPLVHSVGRQTQRGGILLFQSAHFKSVCPPEVHDNTVFHKVEWVPERPNVADSLLDLRQRMAREADAAIFAGGKTKKSNGEPGIRQEYELFLRERPQGPVYLIGMLGGAVRDLIREGVAEPNSLAAEEIRDLHESGDVDLIVGTILTDLKRTRARASATVPAPTPPTP
jgi:hypothetical protein